MILILSLQYEPMKCSSDWVMVVPLLSLRSRSVRSSWSRLIQSSDLAPVDSCKHKLALFDKVPIQVTRSQYFFAQP